MVKQPLKTANSGEVKKNYRAGSDDSERREIPSLNCLGGLIQPKRCRRSRVRGGGAGGGRDKKGEAAETAT